MNGIIYVTKQAPQHELQFAYKHLEDQGMNPGWLHTRTLGEDILVRPALDDDPPKIVIMRDMPEKT